jgi:hypothetical protein
MSIELKQAAQQALDALEARCGTNADERQPGGAIEALRTAIQQAESEPCKSFTELRDRHREGVDAELAAMAAEAKTDEPVAWPLRAQVWKRESTQEWVLEIAGTLGDTDMNIRHTQPLSVAYENVPGLPTFYTHPAPGVPDADFDLICNAIDKADTISMEGDYMLDSDDCIAVVRVMQALLSAHHGITAQAKKEGA